MNYRHIYHAGNYSDVVKHIVLIALIKAFEQKEAPFCYIDTHAGVGYYDLLSESAAKTKEYTGGIEKIIQQENPPPLVKTYLDCVHRINNRLTGARFASLRFYPGSTMIAHYFARPNDRIIACELQPQEYQTLKSTFAGMKQISIHHMDGFLSLKAFLPPHERRGLVLIDPPYENPDEFTRIVHSFPAALKRFETGTYAIWYPIKEKTKIERFHQALKLIHNSILILELTIYPDIPQHLNGCGMAIVNPPWKLQETMQETLPWLWKALTIQKQGYFSISLLK